MNCLAIIQARMGSTRLPGKVMLPLEGLPVIEHVISRVKRSKKINQTFIATSIEENNLPLIEKCASLNCSVFAGSEDDVLDRFYQIAKLIKPSNIVRITADCPLIDSNIIDRVIQEHEDAFADYTSNTLTETFPDGLDVEVFRYPLIEAAWKNASLPSEREHVTPYMRNTKNGYKIHSVSNSVNLGKKRWTLDNDEDYLLIKKIYSSLYPRNSYFGIKEILEYLSNHPEVEEINSNIKRNEGYQKSLKNDGE